VWYDRQIDRLLQAALFRWCRYACADGPNRYRTSRREWQETSSVGEGRRGAFKPFSGALGLQVERDAGETIRPRDVDSVRSVWCQYPAIKAARLAVDQSVRPDLQSVRLSLIYWRTIELKRDRWNLMDSRCGGKEPQFCPATQLQVIATHEEISPFIAPRVTCRVQYRAGHGE